MRSKVQLFWHARSTTEWDLRSTNRKKGRKKVGGPERFHQSWGHLVQLVGASVQVVNTIKNHTVMYVCTRRCVHIKWYGQGSFHRYVQVQWGLLWAIHGHCRHVWIKQLPHHYGTTHETKFAANGVTPARTYTYSQALQHYHRPTHVLYTSAKINIEITMAMKLC